MNSTRRAAPLVFLLLACGGSEAPRKKLSYTENAKRDYESAYQQLREENCLEAEPAFRRITRDFPYSRYAAMSELRVGDCLMQMGKHPQAITAYRRFIRNRPAHVKVPYARYKVAESYYEQIPGDWLLSPAAHERDQSATRDALRQLRQFLVDYPEHKLSKGATMLVQKCLRLLAKHEMSVAEYYEGRGKHRAAIIRYEGVAEGYRGSGLAAESLYRAGKLYLDELRDKPRALDAFRELVKSFPNTAQAARAQRYL